MAHALRTVAASRTTAGLVAIVSDFRGPLDWRSALTVGRGAAHRAGHRGRRPARGRARRRRRADPHRPRDRAGRSASTPPTADSGSAFEEAAGAEREAVAAEFKRLGIRHLRLTTEGSWLAALARGLDSTGRPT